MKQWFKYPATTASTKTNTKNLSPAVATKPSAEVVTAANIMIRPLMVVVDAASFHNHNKKISKAVPSKTVALVVATTASASASACASASAKAKIRSKIQLLQPKKWLK
jgi:hypothetical protein